jgi:hypothetical protein
MNDLYASADYESSIKWSERAIENYRNALRAKYPYIDEATPQEVSELYLNLLTRLLRENLADKLS